MYFGVVEGPPHVSTLQNASREERYQAHFETTNWCIINSRKVSEYSHEHREITCCARETWNGKGAEGEAARKSVRENSAQAAGKIKRVV